MSNHDPSLLGSVNVKLVKYDTCLSEKKVVYMNCWYLTSQKWTIQTCSPDQYVVEMQIRIKSSTNKRVLPKNIYLNIKLCLILNLAAKSCKLIQPKNTFIRMTQWPGVSVRRQLFLANVNQKDRTTFSFG